MGRDVTAAQEPLERSRRRILVCQLGCQGGAAVIARFRSLTLFQLRILRQFVDWQLTHSSTIRDLIDTAWGTKKKAHKKEALAPRPPPPPEDPYSKESLAFHAIGQDQTRTRFWIADSEQALICPFDMSCQSSYFPDSPRMWTSTNPWKVTSLFNSVCETRADYLAAIDTLRACAPPEIEFTSETEVSGKRPHRDVSHWQLIFALELRVDIIDQEFKVYSTHTDKLFHMTDSAKAGGGCTAETSSSTRRC